MRKNSHLRFFAFLRSRGCRHSIFFQNESLPTSNFPVTPRGQVAVFHNRRNFIYTARKPIWCSLGITSKTGCENEVLKRELVWPNSRCIWRHMTELYTSISAGKFRNTSNFVIMLNYVDHDSWIIDLGLSDLA